MICIRPQMWKKCHGHSTDRRGPIALAAEDRRRNRRLARRCESGVLNCSALKHQYRDIIIGDRPGVALVYLKGSYELIRRRLATRHEHLMPVALLDSQFKTLEEPTRDEHPIVVDVVARPAEIVAKIMHCLQERQSGSSSTEATLQGTGVTGSSKGER